MCATVSGYQRIAQHCNLQSVLAEIVSPVEIDISNSARYTITIYFVVTGC
jgi:hypothetical protein